MIAPSHTIFVLVVIVGLAIALGLVPARPALAQQPAGEVPASLAASWPMEEVVLLDGGRYQGLIQSIGETAVEFVEIRRPQGKSMYLVIWPIERSRIARLERLDETERKRLAVRINRFRNHALIEAVRMESIPLAGSEADGRRTWTYTGKWFALQSTADAESTRRCIVRLEQMFLAYRHVLPPQRKPDARPFLRFRVFGTSDGYYQYLREQEIFIRNPAYYAARSNLVVAGSDIRRLSVELADAQARHQQVRLELESQLRQLPDELRRLRAELEARGELPDNWITVAKAAEVRLKKEQAETYRKLALAERNNATLLQEMVDGMLTTLYHEAFHAYLENYVYPSGQHNVPRWLNEGLAQIFEAGLLEADTLRIDAPIPRALAQLQKDLRSERPLPLASLLTAEQSAFLVPHRGGGDTSARHYLYSWGLAYYLTFERSLLGTHALDQYVSLEAAKLPPVDRFEQLTGAPLDVLEAQWRETMLKLK